MQIGLDEILNVVMGRLALMGNQVDELSRTINILGRCLVKNKNISKEDLKDSIYDEYDRMLNLGSIKSMPSESEFEEMTNNLYTSIAGSPDEFKTMADRYREDLEKAMQKKNSKIEVADANTLNILDNMNNNKKKLII